MRQKRKHYTPEKQAAILHKHLVGKAAVSRVREQYASSLNVFYRWRKEFF